MNKDIETITNNYQELGPRARRVLVLLSDRLAMGAREYKDDFSRGKMIHELLEELLDASVYSAVSLISEAEQ